MKIEYIASETDNTAKIIILSFITERRKLNRLIDMPYFVRPFRDHQ